MTTTAVSLARFSGLAATSVGIAALSALGAFEAWPSPGAGSTAPAMTDTVRATLAERVAGQEAYGRSCSEQPVLTDVVLFERTVDATIVTLRFADALAQTADQQGWIRAYCG